MNIRLYSFQGFTKGEYNFKDNIQMGKEMAIRRDGQEVRIPRRHH